MGIIGALAPSTNEAAPVIKDYAVEREFIIVAHPRASSPTKDLI